MTTPRSALPPPQITDRLRDTLFKNLARFASCPLGLETSGCRLSAFPSLSAAGRAETWFSSWGSGRAATCSLFHEPSSLLRGREGGRRWLGLWATRARCLDGAFFAGSCVPWALSPARSGQCKYSDKTAGLENCPETLCYKGRGSGLASPLILGCIKPAFTLHEAKPPTCYLGTTGEPATARQRGPPPRSCHPLSLLRPQHHSS